MDVSPDALHGASLASYAAPLTRKRRTLTHPCSEGPARRQAGPLNGAPRLGTTPGSWRGSALRDGVDIRVTPTLLRSGFHVGIFVRAEIVLLSR